jgi:hypothetical protein
MMRAIYDYTYVTISNEIMDELKSDPDIEAWWDSKQNWEQDDIIKKIANVLYDNSDED